MSDSLDRLLLMQEALWTVSRPGPLSVETLAREAAVPSTIAALLWARGIRTRQAADRFFFPDPSALFDPFLLKGMAEAADLLLHTARAGARIVVFGDYDVDGVTAVAQLRAALLRVGADAVAFLPHRLQDGYGLKPETVRKVLRRHRPALLITVDCGITAVEGVACARSAGVQVIVTDHHLVPEQLPAGAVVINPRQPGCAYPCKDLAACGIAMKMSQALAARAGVSLSRESLLRAACLGTIADLVPLTGENRIIAASGLAALACSRAPGLTALLAECGVPAGNAPTAEEVAFRIAPRLNAAGRLDTAGLALSLFEECDSSRAKAIARELSARNCERQAIERRVTAAAREKVERETDPESDRILILADAAWHRGVLGIAAARLAREYHRPVLLFAEEEGRVTGSGRSIPGVPLHETLSSIVHLFDEFGGHDQAVGGSLRAGRLPALREAARALFAARVPEDALTRRQHADGDLPIAEVDEELLDWLARFEPHGMGNPRPVFFDSGVRSDGRLRPLGRSRGIAGRLERRDAPLEFLCWEPGDLEALARSGSPFEIQYRLQRGRRGSIEAEIVAARTPRA